MPACVEVVDVLADRLIAIAASLILIGGVASYEGSSASILGAWSWLCRLTKFCPFDMILEAPM